MMFTFLGAAHVHAQIKSYSLGAGVGVVPDYEGSDDYQAVPIPFATAVWNSGRSLELRGLKLKANLARKDFGFGRETWRFGPVANYRFGRDNVDDNKVDELDEVDDSFELGGFVGVGLDNWSFKVEALQDVASGHDGFLLALRGGYRYPLSQTCVLSLGVFTTYADGSYMNSYFSIDSSDAARSGLKQFDADSGFKDVGFEVGASYSFTENWSVRALGRYARLIGDAADSPVTDDRGSENQFLAGAVIIYTFGEAEPRPTEIDLEQYNY
jgi:outer membrane scaffolding protein for murein synthesis (MipA/OmpV family)